MLSSEQPSRRRILAFLTAVPGVMVLHGCGYRPLYATGPQGSGAATELAKVRIGLIANRAGQRLRNHLIDRMNPRGEPSLPAYELTIELSETRQDLGVRKDETRTRANLIMSATFQLRDLTNNRMLFNGNSRSVASFNISDAEFSTISAESAARRRAVEGLSEEITQRVAIFLNRRPSAKR